ncbi:MAG TPA: hypothetical protein DG761_09385, partial [Gammaproteobacteria bacterium]|nr:hypothetical protein [Gammaproteobacteria bacterium]
MADDQVQANTPLAIYVPPGATRKQVNTLRAKAAFFSIHGYVPHEYQWNLIHARFERFQAQCWPRQHGKSIATAWEILYELAESPRKLIWLVAPNYDLCHPIFDELERASIDNCTHSDFCATKINRTDLFIHWSNGSRIHCKSAENYRSLQGRKLDRLFVDEAASISDQNIYYQYLRPMLIVARAGMVAISTPKGFNWFFDLAQQGMDPMQGDYFFGHAPLGCSPYVTRDEIEQARTTMPARVFQQEWEAQFVSDAGAVFRGVKDCVVEGMDASQGPEDYSFYAAGLDLAKHEDYSVITVVDRVRKRQVYFDRFNKVDWHRQIIMFAEVCKKYGDCPCLLDSTGIGD